MNTTNPEDWLHVFYLAFILHRLDSVYLWLLGKI